jgi:CubicO group peptidase (beta-lactamase class C family)
MSKLGPGLVAVCFVGLVTSCAQLPPNGDGTGTAGQENGQGAAHGGLVIEGSPRQAGLDAKALRRIDGLVQAGIRKRAFPGAVVLVMHNGVIAKESAYGYAVLYRDDHFQHLAQPLPMRADTLFDLASLSKLFTTTAALQLYDEGKLKLDAPVARYLPAFAQNGKQGVTVRMLLTHTSGLPPGIPLWRQHGSVSARLSSLYRVKPQFRPGTRYVYSDLNLILLGEIVERVSGQSLDRYIAAHITGPLGMRNTLYNPSAQLRPRVAAGEYQPWTGRGLLWGQVDDQNAWALGGVAGHAGVFSTAHDLAVFAQMILNGGRYGVVQILKPGTVRLMVSNQGLADAPHGLGWELEQPWYMGSMASPATIGHTGFTGTSIVINLKQRLVCILLTNRVHPTRNGPSINSYRQEVADAAETALADRHG